MKWRRRRIRAASTKSRIVKDTCENGLESSCQTSMLRHCKSHHDRSMSVCALNERFQFRVKNLVRASRSNPYIGYFLRHDRPGTYSCRGELFMTPVPVLKSTCTVVSSPKNVRFNETVRHSSIVTIDQQY